MNKLGNLAFQIVSRIPFIGDAPIIVNTVRRTAPHVYELGQYAAKGIFKRQWQHDVGKHAAKKSAAEITSGIGQFILDDAVPIIGRDLGHELARFAFGRDYLEPSLLLGKFFEKAHDRRPEILAALSGARPVIHHHGSKTAARLKALYSTVTLFAKFRG